jgi:hypothetical protein
LIPFYGHGLVYGYAIAVVVNETKAILGVGETLVRGLLKPF